MGYVIGAEVAAARLDSGRRSGIIGGGGLHMANEAQEMQEAQQAAQEARVAFEIEDAPSVEWALGRLEGHNQILLSVIRERARYAREDYQHLNAKLDLAKSEIEAKIGKHNQGIYEQGYQARKDCRALDADMDERDLTLLQVVLEQARQARAAYRLLDSKIDGLRYAIDRLP